jgi:putative hydrolase of the HAD superfamily
MNLRTSNIKNILFDADDTLWHDSKYFRALEERLLNLGIELNISLLNIKNCLTENLRNFETGEAGFANAVLKTATDLNYPQTIIISLKKVAKEFLEHPIELTEGIDVLLQSLNYRKVIITKGKFSEQLRKIQNSGLLQFFENVIVLNRKDAAKLRAVLSVLDFKADETLMIGNSIAHDIVPAVANNISAIWYNHDSNYHGRNFELPEKVQEVKFWRDLTFWH